MAGKISVSILEEAHPEVKAIADKWKRVRVLVEEDESQYTGEDFFIKFPKESLPKKEDRKLPFLMGFFNPSHDLISSKGDYIMRRQVTRDIAVEELKAFESKANTSGESLNEFIRNTVAISLQAYGTVFAVADKPKPPNGAANFANRAEEIKAGYPYVSLLHPTQILNWQFDASGNLEWFRYKRSSSPLAPTPFASAAESEIEFVTWTKTEFFRHDKKGDEVEAFAHNFGMVPVVIQASFKRDARKTLGSTTFFSSSRHIIIGNNHLSKANVEIFKASETLMIDMNDWDERSVSRKKNPDTNLPEMTSQANEADVLPVADLEKAYPRYLEKNLEVVIKSNEQAYLYFSYAAEAEATGQAPVPLVGNTNPRGQSGSPQSGVSKSYDFQDMDANLYSFAQDLKSFEEKLWPIIGALLGIKNPKVSIIYPTNFDVRSFEEKVKQIAGMAAAGVQSKTAFKLAMKQLVPDLTQDPGQQSVIEKEIDDSEFEIPPLQNTTIPDANIATP